MLYLDKIAKSALFFALFAVSALGIAQSAGTSSWPTQKPIRLIAVFPPGGSVDQVARV